MASEALSAGVCGSRPACQFCWAAAHDATGEPSERHAVDTHPRSSVVHASTIPFAPALRWDHTPVEMLEARVRAAAESRLNDSVLSAITDAFAFTTVTLVWIVQQAAREDADALIDRIRDAADSIGWPTIDDERACNIDCGSAMLDVSSAAARANAGTKVMLDLTMSEPCLIDLELASGAAWKGGGAAIYAFNRFFSHYLNLSAEGFEAVPLTGQVVGCVDIAGSVDLPDDPDLRDHFDGSVHFGRDLAWNWTGS